MDDELRRAMEPLDFTKRTPGPWTLNEVTGTIYRTGYRGWNVAEVVCKPDGPFIADAPRLLCDRSTLQQAVRELAKALVLIDDLAESGIPVDGFDFNDDEWEAYNTGVASARAILAELPETGP